ncbi:hypothetical protein [Lactococcus petauri]|uniref:hypothetical protein n=1 Tax=Lactococcus petauri TaxID=1940789 RepID=UPI0018AB7C93|nr:hypothetical protein [Lactococcus petauri]
MKQLSTARKFKMITGSDLYATQKKFEQLSKQDDAEMTEPMEFLQYGLYLALYELDLTKAKREFSTFKETGEFDTNDQTLTSLVKTWAKEIK